MSIIKRSDLRIECMTQGIGNRLVGVSIIHIPTGIRVMDTNEPSRVRAVKKLTKQLESQLIQLAERDVDQKWVVDILKHCISANEEVSDG